MSHASYFYLGSGLFSSNEESPLVIFASTPLSRATIPVPKLAKPNKIPDASRTLGSITPVGGTIKPAIIRPIDETKHIQKETLFIYGALSNI